MSNLEAIADRVEIDALRAEFTDSTMMRDWDRFASLFTEDGVWAMPHVNVEIHGRTEIRTNVERLRSLWEFFVQNAHPGHLQLDGDTGVGRTFIEEFGSFRGDSFLNYAIYHDRYQRTADGWKFAERTYEIRYLDTTPLTGTPPHPAADASQASDTEHV